MCLVILSGVYLIGQTKISGIVKDSSTEREIYNLNVLMVETGESVRTDRIGYFQFVDVQPGTYTIRISGVGYQTIERKTQVEGSVPVDMGDILVVYNPSRESMGIITLSDDELEADESSAQSSAGLLQSSRDIFNRTAAFELGSYWFKVRGYDNKYSDVFFNGTRMNKINNSRVNFGNWGGLNDVTRYPFEQTNGIEPSDFAFGSVGGVTYYDTRPSRMRKGVSLAYSLGNRSYNQRVLATYNTGLMENGWAFMGAVARRWAEEGVIDGTFYDSWAYYLGIEKKINNQHTINFTAFGAPTRRAGSSPNTQEIYDLMGKNYNAYWGWQNGDKRSERVRKFHEPIFMLTHHWDFTDGSKLLTSVSYQFGKDSRSRLDWYRANNPSPSYYRNAPSYYILNEASEDKINEVIDLWRNDSSYSQIDWASLYQQNQKEGGAAYVLAGDVNEDKIITFSSLFKTDLSSDIKFTSGISYQNTKSHLYREVIDLLGGNYFVNHNSFQNVYYNIDEDPNRRIYKGDKYQYDYEINHTRADLFAQTEISLGKFDLTLGGKAVYTSLYRNGNYRHQQYENNSKGKSKTYDFWDFGAKMQLLYELNGRNFFQLNGMYATYAPTSDEVFPNARSNDYTINQNNFVNNANNLTSTKIASTDLSYILRAARFKARATGFYTKFFDDYKKNFGYIDEGQGSNNLFGAEYIYNIDKQFIGGEIALEAQVTSTITVNAVASLGQFTYSNNPTYQRFSDSFIINQADEISETAGATAPMTTYLKNYRVATGPQQAFSIGFQYRDPKFWWVGASANYLASNYLDPAPYRRTSAIYGSNLEFTDAEMATITEFLAQEKFSNEFMLNVNAGKTFRIGKYFMGISVNVNNVLNNKNYISGGFEQTRIGNVDLILDRPQYQNVFAPKYWYDTGRSYFINAFFRF